MCLDRTAESRTRLAVGRHTNSFRLPAVELPRADGEGELGVEREDWPGRLGHSALRGLAVGLVSLIHLNARLHSSLTVETEH